MKARILPRRLALRGSLHRTCAAGWAAFGLAVVGGVLASRNPDWWTLSVCALGMKASPAPWVFDYGMLTVALIFALLAARTRALLRSQPDGGGLTARQVDAVTGAVLLVAAQVVVLALIPYDVGPVQKLVHNVAGWGSGWVIALSMLLVPRYLRVFDGGFYARTRLALTFFMSFFAGFELGLLTYAEAEIGAIGIAALWSTILFANLEKISAAAPGAWSIPHAEGALTSPRYADAKRDPDLGIPSRGLQ